MKSKTKGEAEALFGFWHDLGNEYTLLFRVRRRRLERGQFLSHWPRRRDDRFPAIFREMKANPSFVSPFPSP